MTRLLFAFFYVLVAACLTNAQAQEPLPTRATPPLFKISNENTEIFLLGTFHILPKGVDWRSPDVGSVIDRAESVWFEVETDTPEFTSTAQKIVAEKGNNPDGVTLTTLLGPVRGGELSTILTNLKIPADALETMRPWQAFLALSSQLIISEGYNPAAGVDSQILREARLRGRNIQFLETAEEQLSLFTDLDQQTELSILQLTIRDWSVQKEQLPRLLMAWKSGDIDSIDQLMNDEMRATLPAAFDALMTSRNKSWAEKIIPMMDKPGVILIAVGAGHLAGKGSLPEILADAGLNIERVLPKATTPTAPDAPIASSSLPSGALEKLFPAPRAENTLGAARPNGVPKNNETPNNEVNETAPNPVRNPPPLSDDDLTDDFIEQLIRSTE